ncbi:hypothetical protein I2494_02575 [Budviciaceae bacterium BWR-B9]|uniref:Uncharacterized protein n=1 Tax=Limnobaculum allomyrinae TaxID=2791986 RepID=A0ABS1ILK9_9GAMM|nr:MULTISPECIES: hypothetical protein [Limnobaculum]MBK5142618.1 hypothetical protein [Limnobaculum allomyrinae]MBV7690496.1 hypothetical protein [Limnobaculum sp. M2-1]
MFIPTLCPAGKPSVLSFRARRVWIPWGSYETPCGPAQTLFKQACLFVVGLRQVDPSGQRFALPRRAGVSL